MGFRGPDQAFNSDITVTERGIIRARAARVGDPYDACHQASLRLMDDLLCSGIDAQMLRCSGLKTDAPEADARWIKLGPQSYWIHFMVKMGGNVIDLTRRQFFPESGYPHVQSYDACEAEWDKIGFVS